MLSDCVLRQFRACIIDLLGLGFRDLICMGCITFVYNPSQSRLPSFCAIPIFHFLICIYLSPHFLYLVSWVSMSKLFYISICISELYNLPSFVHVIIDYTNVHVLL